MGGGPVAVAGAKVDADAQSLNVKSSVRNANFSAISLHWELEWDKPRRAVYSGGKRVVESDLAATVVYKNGTRPCLTRVRATARSLSTSQH